MVIGILAIQGSFEEHKHALQKLGIDYIELRQKKDLSNAFDALILPGGESTVQGKLLIELDMFDELKQLISSGLPVLATCAGMILLAEKISNDNNKYFQTMPITVKRNAYGRQLGSFHTTANFTGLGEIPMTFIRAPYVEHYNSSVDVLATVQNKIVAVQFKNQIALAFHPELDSDSNIYQKFIHLIEKKWETA